MLESILSNAVKQHNSVVMDKNKYPLSPFITVDGNPGSHRRSGARGGGGGQVHELTFELWVMKGSPVESVGLPR